MSNKKRKVYYYGEMMFYEIGVNKTELMDVFREILENLSGEILQTRRYFFRGGSNNSYVLYSRTNFLVIFAKHLSSNQCVVWLDNKATLYHKNYKTIKIPAGIYYVIIS